MSKSVTIPTYMQPDFVCTINNTTYRYKAGTTQTVPDAVAELIENINAQEPVENPPETLEHEIARIATQIAEPAVVVLTYSEEDEAWSGNKTFGEIAALHGQGKQVLVGFSIPSFEGWGYRAPITLFGKELVDGEEYYWFEVQIVDPNTNYLMALVANGVADDRSWGMYTYPMQTDPE